MSKVRQFKTTDNVVHDIYGQNVQGMDWDDYQQLTPEQRNSDIAYFVPDVPSGLTLVEQTVSGLPANVASFSNAVDVPLKTLKVSIVPVQSGSGEPSPSNPRPISGWTGANISVVGSNLINPSYMFGTSTIYTVNSNGSITASSSNGKAWTDNTEVPPLFIKAGTYTITRSDPTGSLQIRSSLDNYANNLINTANASATFTLSEDCYIKMKVNTGSGATYPNTTFVYLEVGSLATTYKDYVGTTTTIPLGQEVYGGELDVTSGVLMIDTKKFDITSFDGIDTGATNPNGNIFYKIVSEAYKHYGIDISNIFSENKTANKNNIGLYEYGSTSGSSQNFSFCLPSTIDTLEKANQWLSDNPTYIVSKLATPITIQLTPTQINSLLGANNIWADCGQVNECTYYIYGQGTKPQLYFNDDVYAGSEVIANPEDAVPTEKLNKLAINGIVYDINPNVGERAIIDKLYEASNGDGAPLTTAINYTGGHKLSDYDIITVTLCDPTTYTGDIFSQVYSFSPKSLKSSGAQIPYFPIIMNGINDSECTVFFNENSFTVITHSGDTGEEPSVYSVYGLKFNTVAITEDIAGGDWTSLISQTGGSWSTATALPDGTTHVAVFLEYNNNVDMPFIFSVAEYDKIAQLSGNSIVQYGLSWKIGSDYDDIAYKYDSANGTVAVYAAYSGITIKAYAIAAKAAQIDVPIMQGATSSADGDKGLVPAPEAGDEDKFLKGDGSWDDVPAGGSTVTITPETIAEPKAKVADYSIDGVSGSIYAQYIPMDVNISNNKCDPDGILWDKGIDSTGAIVDATGKAITEEIAVEGHYAFFGRDGEAMQANRLGLYKKDGTFERVSNAQSYDVSNCNKIVVMFPYTSQSNVFFVGFSDTQTAPQIDEYSNSTTIKSDYLPYNKNPYDGLDAVAFGTSLTARAEEDHKYETTTYGYLTYLRDYSRMIIDNQGISGATILSDTSDKSIYVAITGYTDYIDKDVCILEGFCNDWYKDGQNTLGQYTDTGTTTVCGRLRSAINYIMTQNPHITIFVILDHYGKVNGQENWSSTATINGYTPYQYYEELSKVCESLGVVVIKEYALSGIGELAPQYLQDYVHLNNLGAKQSGLTIWNQMKLYAPKKRS